MHLFKYTSNMTDGEGNEFSKGINPRLSGSQKYSLLLKKKKKKPSRTSKVDARRK